MVRYLKDRGVYVLFNTNGTVLTEKTGRALIEAGLDELRVSLDAADAKTYRAVRGKNYFDRIFEERARLPGAAGARRPRQATRLRLAHRPSRDGARPAGLRPGGGADRRQGGLPAAAGVLRGRPARPGASRSGALRADDARGGPPTSRRPRPWPRRLGLTFSASGAATEPGMSLKRRDNGSPWGALPAPLDRHVFHRQWPGSAVLHRALLAARLRELHARRRHPGQPAPDLERGPAYTAFREALLTDLPPSACASCGMRWEPLR